MRALSPSAASGGSIGGYSQFLTVQAIYHQASAAIRLRLQRPLGIGAPIPTNWIVRKLVEATVTRNLYRELRSKMSLLSRTPVPLTFRKVHNRSAAGIVFET